MVGEIDLANVYVDKMMAIAAPDFEYASDMGMTIPMMTLFTLQTLPFPIRRHDAAVTFARTYGYFVDGNGKHANPLLSLPVCIREGGDEKQRDPLLGFPGNFHSELFLSTNLNLILIGEYDPACEGDIIIPSAETMYPARVEGLGFGSETPERDENGRKLEAYDSEMVQPFVFPGSHMTDLYVWTAILAAEVCIKFKRFDEALAHVSAFEQKSWCIQVSMGWCNYFRGRVLLHKALEEGGLAQLLPQVIVELEQSVAKAQAFNSPLMVALSLKEIIAALAATQQSSQSGSQKLQAAQSRLEEVLFEMTMEEQTELKKHLESGSSWASE